MLKIKKGFLVGLVLFIFSLSFLTGCNGSSDEISLYTLQGTIKDINNGDIIDSAKVEVGSKSTESDSEGIWQIKDLKAGKYTIKAAKDGYVDFSNEISINSDEVYNIEMQKLLLANQPPAIDSIADKNIASGNELTFTVIVSDPDGDTVILSAGGLPAGASFDTATGNFSWTPTVDQVGVYEVTFTASDGILSSQETVSIEVVLSSVDSAYSAVNDGIKALVKSDFKTFRSYADKDFIYYEPGKTLTLDGFITYIESINFSIKSIEINNNGIVNPDNKNQISFQGVMTGTRNKMNYIDDIVVLAEKVSDIWYIKIIAVIDA